ncbi:patatin-like phospholipase family protein [Pseudalkalibacillus hwajinpoensis]|uniref:patatin-like phospholipase family protein n=1 Tax=Guptibacillus hwajinpoensis TaxID=208199 RepID=UPI00325C279F
MDIDGVFSGGGVKGIALVGALQAVEKKGFTFKRTAGTSAGALMASLIMAGYNGSELESILLDTDLSKLLDRNPGFKFPLMRWFMLYWKLGLYSGKDLEMWVCELLRAKGIETFGDLPEGSLKIIASDITKGRLIVFPDDLPQYGFVPEKFSVAKAVRMSASLPFFFKPQPLYTIDGKKHYIVDGGILSNFPLWVFQPSDWHKPLRPVLGFQLSANFDNVPEHKIINAIDMYQALFDTMKQAHDARYIDNQKAKNIVFIPVNQSLTTEFKLERQGQKKLIQLGKERTTHFLDKWRKLPIEKAD